MLPQEPTVLDIRFSVPTDPVWLAIGARSKLEIAVSSDGKALANVRLAFRSADTTIATVDSLGYVRGVRRGATNVHVSLITAAGGGNPPRTALPVRVMIGGMRLARAVDSLFAIGDTLLVRPGYLDAYGEAVSAADSAKIVPTLSLLSAGRAVQLLGPSGPVVAKANGTDTLRASVDTSKVDLVVTVAQRADSVRIPRPDTTFSALGQSRRFSALAWDRRRTAISDQRFNWVSRNANVASVDSTGTVTAKGNGSGWIVVAAVGGWAKARDSVTVIVRQVASKVEVTPDTLRISVADTASLNAEARDANNNPVAAVTFSWSSSNTSVATVDGRGMVTAVDTGRAWIKAKAPSGAADSSLVLAELRADSVAVSPDTLRFTALADTQRLSATAFRQRQPIPGKAIRWSSTMASVATVDSSGLVTAVGNGTAKIVARADAAADTATVTVEQIVDSVVVTPSTVELSVGDTARLEAAIRDRNGFLVSGASATWSTSDSTVARVSPAGLVTAVRVGSAIVTAAAGGKSGSARVSVTVRAKRVVVIPESLRFTALGDTAPLAAQAFDSAGQLIAEKTFTWSSLDTMVARVDQAGLVTAVGNGSTAVVASADGVADTALVVVSQVVDKVLVRPDSAVVQVGDTVRFTAEAQDRLGNVVSGVRFSWSSSDTR